MATGLIASAGLVLLRDSGMTVENLVVATCTVVILRTKKVPAPVVVVLALGAGGIVS